MNMIDYKWRTFLELPRFDHTLLETPFDSPSFGAIGISEITTTPGPGAVLMAVSNAIGRQLYDYPLTPEIVLKALGKVKGGKPA
jgi:xanthine dehydrogenase molybdenum-binding subunit